MAIPAHSTKLGIFPEPILDEIVSNALIYTDLATVTDAHLFWDVKINAIPGPHFGCDLARTMLGPNLSRHRNLQIHFLKLAVPRHTWHFSSGPAFFSFLQNVESLCGRETVDKISSLEFELDFFDVEGFDELMLALEALGRSAINPSAGQRGTWLPGLQKLQLSFIQIPQGFQDKQGPVFADEAQWSWDWARLRAAVVDMRVGEMSVSGLKDKGLERTMEDDAMGVTRKRMEMAGRLMAEKRWSLLCNANIATTKDPRR